MRFYPAMIAGKPVVAQKEVGDPRPSVVDVADTFGEAEVKAERWQALWDNSEAGMRSAA